MYNCKIYHDNLSEKVVLLDIDVENLKVLASELGMTYQQVADLNSRGIKKYQKFKYFPKIEITKIEKKDIRVKI